MFLIDFQVAALKEGGAGSNTILEDLGSGMEVAELKERVEKLEVELHGERELLREQKVKAEEARAQATSLQCQVIDDAFIAKTLVNTRSLKHMYLNNCSFSLTK